MSDLEALSTRDLLWKFRQAGSDDDAMRIETILLARLVHAPADEDQETTYFNEALEALGVEPVMNEPAIEVKDDGTRHLSPQVD